MTGQIEAIAVAEGATLEGYRVDAQGQSRGTVLVLHEIFGLTQSIRGFCDEVAAAGYDVVSPSLFDRVRRGFVGDISRLEEAFEVALRGQPFETTLADVLHMVDAMAGDGPLVVTGFCYGGSLAFRIAQERDTVAAANCFYGGMIPQFTDTPVRIPTICHFGRKDEHIPLDGVERLIAARPEVTTWLYDAGHGFVLGRPDYNPAASALAKARMFALFTEHGGTAG